MSPAHRIARFVLSAALAAATWLAPVPCCFAQIAGGGGQNGGQAGAGGILVDAQGVVRAASERDKTGRLDRKRREQLAARALPGDVNVSSPIRKVSLAGVEAACEKYAQNREHVPSDLHYLAGLQRIDYVFVDPDRHDIIIAGPAEGFAITPAGRALGNASGRPPLRLDDLLIALRSLDGRQATIGCSIDPIQENLARFKSFVSRDRGVISPAQAKAKFAKLGAVLGLQNVRIFGVPPDSHFAEVLLAADIAMKRLAIGIDRPPIRGFRSHLALVGAGENTMQRWWLSPLYDPFVKSGDGLAFAFHGPRVRLQSEEQLVADSGTYTAASFMHPSARKFSQQFTERYPELADAAPVFAELHGLFDLAILAALLEKERLFERAGWRMTLFLDEDRADLVKRPVPRQIHSVSNYKTIGKSLYVAQVSGGVTIDAGHVLPAAEFTSDPEGKLAGARGEALAPEKPEQHPWWWD